MRLITVAAAAMLLSLAVPAFAHTGTAPHSTCGKHSETNRYGGSMTIDDAVYAQQGWWDARFDPFDLPGPAVRMNNLDERQVGFGGATATCGTGTNAGTTESPVWIHLDKTKQDAPFHVTVKTTGPVVGALDVFKYSHDTRSITPVCPQDLVVPDIYPDEGEGTGAYLFRLLHETVGYHQRGTSASFDAVDSDPLVNRMEITLDPSEAPHGYVIAIYPQASSDLEATGDTTRTPKIHWNVTADKDMTVNAFDAEEQKSDAPLDVASWVGAEEIFHCADQVPELPPVLTSGQASELPTVGSPAADPSALFGAHLPS